MITLTGLPAAVSGVWDVDVVREMGLQREVVHVTTQIRAPPHPAMPFRR